MFRVTGSAVDLAGAGGDYITKKSFDNAPAEPYTRFYDIMLLVMHDVLG
jgi:hypothetical protein